MQDKPEGEEYVAAAQRVEQALSGLESSLRSLNGRVRSLSRIESDVAKIEMERAKLASELGAVSVRAKKLDKGASEVSRRLVSAMEEVKSVLEQEEKPS
ncbi:hypothetical protein MNBD_ALPHA11-2372 [hydrothermal vent metagenome]|uniref:DUF4164 family protein n=1 Tax=hydrothermal vent metagenome TaxID=652676 RepID=A0A3B0U469_9ZZZZ